MINELEKDCYDDCEFLSMSVSENLPIVRGVAKDESCVECSVHIKNKKTGEQAQFTEYALFRRDASRSKWQFAKAFLLDSGEEPASGKQFHKPGNKKAPAIPVGGE